MKGIMERKLIDNLRKNREMLTFSVKKEKKPSTLLNSHLYDDNEDSKDKVMQDDS